MNVINQLQAPLNMRVYAGHHEKFLPQLDSKLILSYMCHTHMCIQICFWLGSLSASCAP